MIYDHIGHSSMATRNQKGFCIDSKEVQGWGMGDTCIPEMSITF